MKCDVKDYDEWTQEGLAEINMKLCRTGTSPVTNEAYMLVYETSGTLAQFRWYRRDYGLCPIVWIRAFLYLK